MKVAILWFLAVLVAVNADVHKNITVTSQEIDSLMSDYIDLYIKNITAKEPVPSGDLPEHDIESKDVELNLQLTDNVVYFGEGAMKSVSSNLSDSEYSGQVEVAFKGLKIVGKVNAEGTIKGKTFNEVGDYEMVWSIVGDKLSMKASYDDHSVTVVNFEVDSIISSPQIFLKGLSVDEATLNEIASLYGQAFENDMKIMQELTRLEIKAGLGSLNELFDGKNIQEIYEQYRKEVPAK